jgi:YggT family protein
MISFIYLISILFRIYEILLITRIIMSWLPHNRYHPLITRLYEITDPYLNIFRSLNLNFGGIDLSPIVAFLVLRFAQRLLLQILLF